MVHRKSEKIILVSSETELFAKLEGLCQSKGYRLKLALDWREVLETFFDEEPDLILYDLGMSDHERAVEICRIRLRFQGPLIMLMTEDDPVFSTLTLELGADDCICLSAPDQLLAAKIMSLLRRSQLAQRGKRSRIVLGDLVMDTGQREVRLEGESLDLTTIEYDILCFLACNTGSVVSREEIHQALYKAEYDGLNRSIDLYISRLRKKLGDDPESPKFLKTVRGAGYLLVDRNH